MASCFFQRFACFPIFVHSLQGLLITLMARESMHIDFIKAMILGKTGIPVAVQCLQYEGKVLPPFRTVGMQ